MNAPAGLPVEKPFIVGLGASAGGLEALRELLEEARPQDGVAYVVVQHLDPTHESLMAEILRRHTRLQVTQVGGGEKVASGHVYIIPPGSALGIEDGALTLQKFEAPRGMRRPIDTFFRALSIDQSADAICVVLSGTGADGSSGLKSVKEGGGLCIAQEPSSAKYDGMPAAAIATGVVDYVLPAGEIAPAIVDFIRRRKGEPSLLDAAEVRREALSLLRAATGHDFSRYKETTLSRRLERRLQVLGLEAADAYLPLLRGDRNEAQRLMSEILINVTRFFRDPDAFEALRQFAIAPLVAQAAPEEELRVWVPACATGEEGYSIAMLFAAEARAQGRDVAFQIFATDIDESVLEIARSGVYPPGALDDVTEEFRARFFVASEGGYRVNQAIRDRVRFTAHNLIRDPPFSRVALLSCRNLFIYLQEGLQAELWPILHYAIRPGGYLFLGMAEGLGGREDLFAAVNQKARLFQRRDVRAQFPLQMPAQEPPDQSWRASRPRGRGRAPLVEPYVSRLVENYAPPSVVVDADGTILNATGRLARYLDIPADDPGPHMLADVAFPGLRDILSNLLRAVIKQRKRVVARDVEARTEFGVQKADFFAEPLPHGAILIVFSPKGPLTPIGEDFVELDTGETEQQILEEELRESRYRLRAATEELETANEELKSSNEEMMSMNEELQSTNEELITVNDELKIKIDQLIEANADIANFFSSTALAVVMLDRQLNVRSFSDAAADLFAVHAKVKGVPIGDLPTSLDSTNFIDLARRVLDTGSAVSDLVSSRNRIWSLFVTPYRSAQGAIGGVTLVFTDVSEQRRAGFLLERERNLAQLAMRIAGVGAWEYEIESGKTVVDEQTRNLFGVSLKESNSIDFFLERIDAGDRANVETQMRRAISGEAPYEVVFKVNQPDGAQRVLKGLGAMVDFVRPRRLVGVNFDVTSEQEAAALREIVIREMNHRMKNMFAVIASILRGASRSASSKEELVNTVSNRIVALSKAHSLALTAEKASVPVRTLVATALEPYAKGAEFTIEGPEVTAPNESVTSLALIFHEWATNATKYGVLGAVPGALSVVWRRLDSGGARLTWIESYATPQPPPPAREGFGSRLVALSCATINATLTQERSETQFAMTLDFAVETF